MNEQPKLELWTICDPADPIPAGQHLHKCSDCGTTWRHGNDIPGVTTEAQFEEAHSCPRCGKYETYKFRTSDEDEEEDGMMDVVELFAILDILFELDQRQQRKR